MSCEEGSSAACTARPALLLVVAAPFARSGRCSRPSPSAARSPSPRCGPDSVILVPAGRALKALDERGTAHTTGPGGHQGPVHPRSRSGPSVPSVPSSTPPSGSAGPFCRSTPWHTRSTRPSAGPAEVLTAHLGWRLHRVCRENHALCAIDPCRPRERVLRRAPPGARQLVRRAGVSTGPGLAHVEIAPIFFQPCSSNHVHGNDTAAARSRAARSPTVRGPRRCSATRCCRHRAGAEGADVLAVPAPVVESLSERVVHLPRRGQRHRVIAIREHLPLASRAGAA